MAAVVERPPCAATVRVIGQLRAPSTSALRRAVTALLLDGKRHILLDLAAVTDLDAGGAARKVDRYAARKVSQSEGGSFYVLLT